MGHMLALRLGEVSQPPDEMLRHSRVRADVSTPPLGRVQQFVYQATTSRLAAVITNDLERPVTYDAVGNEVGVSTAI
jgi:hypothetical protein